MGYHSGIARPVFLNREAFWICYSGTAHPEVVEMVEWEWDDSFEKFFIKEINEQMTQDNVKSHLKELVCDAAEEESKLKEDESIQVFIMDGSNTPVRNMSTFLSKDPTAKVQKFIKTNTKAEFLEGFKGSAESEIEKAKENPIERDEHGALIIDEKKSKKSLDKS